MSRTSFSARVLVIDDEESVRDSFMSTLAPAVRSNPQLSEAASLLFDDPQLRQPAPRTQMQFSVDLAATGREAVRLVEQAVAQQQPYAVIFCDMRMPGWDGVETGERLRQHDQRAEVVFVTAYSDHSIDAIVERAGANVGYFVKPFLGDEIRQLATKLVLDWNRARELESLMRTVISMRGEAGDVRRLFTHLLGELCAWLDTDSAALFRVEDGTLGEFELGIGALSDPELARSQVAVFGVTGVPGSVLERDNGALVLPVAPVGLAVALCRETRLTPDRKYLLQVFLEHAGLAIRNSDIQAQMVERERFAAVGEALAFVLHDVRGPVGNALMLSSLLNPDQPQPYPLDELAARIQKQLQRAIGMLGDTLALCKDHIDLERRSVELGSAFAEELEDLGRDLQRRGIAFEVAMTPGLTGEVDVERLWRVLWNLIGNAARAVKGCHRPTVVLRGQRQHGDLRLSVSDNGPGVPEAVLAKLFQPFASAEANGTGFGLAIAQKIAMAHGGTVTHRREDGWTTFEVTLPSR